MPRLLTHHPSTGACSGELLRTRSVTRFQNQDLFRSKRVSRPTKNNRHADSVPRFDLFILKGQFLQRMSLLSLCCAQQGYCCTPVQGHCCLSGLYGPFEDADHHILREMQTTETPQRNIGPPRNSWNSLVRLRDRISQPIPTTCLPTRCFQRSPPLGQEWPTRIRE
jgi:hypothetical protein